MVYQLEQLHYHKVRHLIENSAHELSIEAVIAATCWAKASMLKETIKNIQKLAETGQTWFYQYLSVNTEFHYWHLC